MKALDSFIAGIIRNFHSYNDAILGVILAIGSAALFAMSFSIKIMKNPVSALDSARFFPQLVFGCLVPIGLALIVRGIKKAPELKETAPAGEKLEKQVVAFKRSIVALGSIAIYIALIEPLGFIPAAIVYMLFNMFYMSEKAGWKVKAYVITSVAVALLCYYLFRKFVYVQMPAGILKGVLG